MVPLVDLDLGLESASFQGAHNTQKKQAPSLLFVFVLRHVGRTPLGGAVLDSAVLWAPVHFPLRCLLCGHGFLYRPVCCWPQTTAVQSTHKRQLSMLWELRNMLSCVQPTPYLIPPPPLTSSAHLFPRFVATEP